MAERESYRALRGSVAKTMDEAAELAEEVRRDLLEGQAALARTRGTLEDPSRRLRRGQALPVDGECVLLVGDAPHGGSKLELEGVLVELE